MFDAVSAQQAVIKELNSRSSQMIENWKQTARTQRAEILGNRKRLLDQISSEKIMLTPCKPSDSEQTIESKYNLCMNEIRAKAGTEIVESWKLSAMEQRRLIFAAKHQIIADIKTSQPALKSSQQPARADLMRELNTKTEPTPEWKEKLNAKKCEQMRLKNEAICDIREHKFQLKSNTTQVEKFNRVLESLRQPTEQWKLNIHSSIANPHKNMRLVLAELLKGEVTLNETQCARAETLKAIRAEPVPEWKQMKANQFVQIRQAMRAVVCDIAERKFELKKVANRTALLADIRAAYNIPESTTFCEAWKEAIRAKKSKVLLAHKNCMVSLEHDKVALRTTKKSRREQMQECLKQLRSEPVPAWKEKLMSNRTATFELKNQLNRAIASFKTSDLRLVEKSLQARKTECLAQLKSKFGVSAEGWKEAKAAQLAHQHYSKHIALAELLETKPVLKKTETIEQTKLNLMSAIRAKSGAAPVPAWMEAERKERAATQNARNAVLSELRKSKNSIRLGETKSLEQVMQQIHKEIRGAKQPLEAWREEERQAQAQLYQNKRALMQVIGNGVSSLENKRSQAELKEALLREIRAKGDFAVPAWKEARMQVRAQVLKNKVALNAAICALKN